VTELIGVVALVEYLIVDESSLETDRSDQSNGMASELQHRKLHAWSQPALRYSLPEIEGGLININEFLVRLILHVVDMVPHIVVLVELQLLALNLILPVSVVRPLELYAIPRIIILQRCRGEL